MIQDIYPHRLLNRYDPTKKCRAEDTVICVDGNRLLINRVEIFPHASELPIDFDEARYLFTLDARDFYLAEHLSKTPVGFEYMTLKDMRRQLKKPRELMFAAYTAWHLALWYRDNRYCGRCGHRTTHSATERAVQCSECGNVIYPRLLPAVIVGVRNGDRLLVTKYANRDLPFYALIAGFVEIGETLEQTVEREVMEEVGLRVKNIRYYKSQPWGSVQDILTGFICDVDGDDRIRMDRSELKEAIWLSREEIVGQADDWSLTHEIMMQFKCGLI